MEQFFLQIQLISFNAIAPNSTANASNLIAKVTNSIAKVTNSIAKNITYLARFMVIKIDQHCYCLTAIFSFTTLNPGDFLKAAPFFAIWHRLCNANRHYNTKNEYIFHLLQVGYYRIGCPSEVIVSLN